MNRIFLYGTCAIALLAVGMAILSVPRAQTKEKQCREKEGILVKSPGGYLCIKKDVEIK